MNPIFTGSGVALITPFKDNGDVNYEKLGELIDMHILQRTDAIVICGSSGEASTLSDDEHISVIKYAVDKTAHRVPIIAGVGSNDTRHAIKLSQNAEDCGVDALLSVTPYYNKTSQNGLIQHFSLIASNVSKPIILYNVPSRTNLCIEPKTIAVLSKVKNIVGIKECVFSNIAETINLCGNGFYIYSGEDENILPALAMGGVGVISVMANIIPKITHDLVQFFLDGDLDASRKLQLKTIEIVKMLFCDISPIPLKAAMNLMGMNVGNCRLPLVSLDNAKLKYVEEILQKHKLLKTN